MKTSLFAAAAVMAGLLSPALAADPVGEWVVADKTARIQIGMCPSGLWGVVSWLKEMSAVDENNPDRSKRNRSMIGVPILLGMKAGKKTGQWDGEVYNAKDGRKYDAHITLEGANSLQIEGCVLGGIICSGEKWTRYQEVPRGNAPPASAAPRRPQTSTAQAAPVPAPAALDVCANSSALESPHRTAGR